MAEKLCQLKKKGGAALTESILWTNSSPTSSLAPKDISLNDSFLNYSYIKFSYKINTSSSEEYQVLYPADLVKKSAFVTNVPIILIGARHSTQVGVSIFRPITYVSDTSLHFANATTITGSGTYNDNNYNIITQITGVK
jgi:hypothetical protein